MKKNSFLYFALPAFSALLIFFASPPIIPPANAQRLGQSCHLRISTPCDPGLECRGSPSTCQVPPQPDGVINRSHIRWGGKDFIDNDMDYNFEYTEINPKDHCADTIDDFDNNQLKDKATPDHATLTKNAKLPFGCQFDYADNNSTVARPQKIRIDFRADRENFLIAFIWLDPRDPDTIIATDKKTIYKRKNHPAGLYLDFGREDRCIDTLDLGQRFESPNPGEATLQEKDSTEKGRNEFDWYPFPINSRTENTTINCWESPPQPDVKIGAPDPVLTGLLLDDTYGNPLADPQTPPCHTFGQNPCKSFDTGLGEIKTDSAGFIKSVFGVILAASGGIALLLIIRAGYKIMTSRGNPEAIKEGRDQLIAAIVGLMFLIFSFVLLQLIGIDILRIPGFG